MCIAVPVEVVEIEEEKAVVELEGITKKVNIDLVPQVKAGDYVLLHSGCAIKKVKEKKAAETLELLKSLAEEGRY